MFTWQSLSLHSLSSGLQLPLFIFSIFLFWLFCIVFKEMPIKPTISYILRCWGGLVSVFAFPAITLYVCICVSSNPLELSNRTLVTAKLQSQPLLEENLHILSLTSLKRKSPKTQILYLTDWQGFKVSQKINIISSPRQIFPHWKQSNVNFIVLWDIMF